MSSADGTSLTGRRRWYATIVAALLLPVLGALLAASGAEVYSRKAADQAQELRALEELDEQVDAVQDHVQNAESAVRAFRLTGATDPSYLQAYEAWRRRAPEELGTLLRGARPFPALLPKFERLTELIDLRLEALEALRDVDVADSEAERREARAGWQVSQQLAAAVTTAEQATEDMVDDASRAVEAAGLMEDRVWLLVPLGLLGTVGVAIHLMRQGARRIQVLKRNTANLVEERPLEPYPYDGGQLDELAIAVEQTAALLASRERDRLAAHQEADRANEAKTAFLSRMSHELRTPLTAVLGFAELLEMDELTDSQRDGVRQIRVAGAHLLTLINEVLDISRIESGNLQVSIEPMELGPVVADALTLIRPIAEERGVRLPRACGDGVYIRADRQRVTQVLLNLFSNAVKYNREFGEVSMRCEVTDDQVRLAVTDTGLGIAPELLPRMFNAFDRLGAEQRGIEGTGVGLMLSRGLVEAMGGTLTVASVPGEGSTFTVSLPGAIEPMADVPAFEADAALWTGLPDRDIRVLYVEDNQANIDLVTRFLQRRPGVRVMTTLQGRLALELARVHRPDLVLLDLHLPDLDGESVLRELRGHPETADVRVAMLTADATSGQERRLLAMGADAYVTKPLDFHRLVALLDDAGRGVRA